MILLVKLCIVVSLRDYLQTLAPFAKPRVASVRMTLYQTMPSSTPSAFMARHPLAYISQEAMELTNSVTILVAPVVTQLNS